MAVYDLFFGGIYWRVGFLGHVTFCLTFWGIGKPFSKAIALFYIPTCSLGGLQFLTNT